VSRARLACACALLLCANACTRAPTSAELRPVVEGRPAREPLPDDSERLASRVAAAALAGRTDHAIARSLALEREDKARRERGEPTSGLSDNAAEVVASCDGSDAYPAHAQELLAQRPNMDPALRRRLERAIANAPLARADADIAADRQWKAGSIVNRVVEPVSKLLLTGVTNPLESVRSTVSTLLTANKFPSASVRERRALGAWDEWLVRNPDDPRAPEIAARAEYYREKLRDERYDRALAGAEDATANREFQRARILAGRALANRPDSARAAALLEGADSELEAREAGVRASLVMETVAPAELDATQRALYVELARESLVERAESVASSASALRASGAPAAIGGELVFVESFAPLARGDEDGFFEVLAKVPDAAPPGDTIARQSVAILRDPAQNPYAYYEASISADRRAQLGWLALGRHASGPKSRNLPRPVEYLLDVPAFAISLVTFPIRLLQYPSMAPKFGDAVLVAGERYTDRRPHGQHAEEVDRDLASRYAARGQPSSALRHEEALPDPDPAAVARYREQIAEQMLASADRERRIDMKLALLAAVARSYSDTPAGARARTEFIAQKAAITPQRIRLTHDFLVEHPELWAPGALELNPELLDGSLRNGEIAKPGVVLLGQSVIEIPLEGRDEPAVREIAPEDFARFVAKLEQISYASLTRDPRETASADPARDAFLASARLGGVERPDLRPSARSEAVYESTHEKHGFVNARESILPIDLVLRGDIESLGLAAFPRIRLPETPGDAMLYD
jgi:hypothetical protein